MTNPFKKLIEWIKKPLIRVARRGFNEFIARNRDVVAQILLDLAKVNSGRAFHLWEGQAREEVRARIKFEFDNWPSSIVSLIFEELRAEEKI